MEISACAEVPGRGFVNITVRVANDVADLEALREVLEEYFAAEGGHNLAAGQSGGGRLRVFSEQRSMWEELTSLSGLSPSCQVFLGSQLPSLFPPPSIAARNIANTSYNEWWQVATQQEPSLFFASTLAGEYLGTALHAFFSVLTLLLRPDSASLAVSASIACLTLSLSHISTAQFNPTTTAALVAARKTPLILGLLAFAMQLLGATAGAGLALAVLPGGEGSYDLFEAAATYRRERTLTSSYPKPTLFQACLFTFFSGVVLCTVILSIVVRRTRSELKRHIRDLGHAESGLAVGCAYYVVNEAFLDLLGITANPAISFAMAAVGTGRDEAWEELWVFLAVPLLAGATVGFIYRKSRLRARRPQAEEVVDVVEVEERETAAHPVVPQNDISERVVVKTVRIVDVATKRETRLRVAKDTHHTDALATLERWNGTPGAYLTDSQGVALTLSFAGVNEGEICTLRV